ncbi:MAG: DUF4422 domain-containing protein [Oscillospiraceae bacterium]
MKLAIYGAQSLALGMYTALRALHPALEITGFVVTERQGNPARLAGLPVTELARVTDSDTHFLIAVPENLHAEITAELRARGFHRYTCMDSEKEACLMERFYRLHTPFAPLRDLPAGSEPARLFVYQVKNTKDQPLRNPAALPDWVVPIQSGAAMTDERVAALTDSDGDGISEKNEAYSELTALYHLWKNAHRLAPGSAYDGLFHYRRSLALDETDLRRIEAGQPDMILPFPTIHAPDINAHHTRYLTQSDWDAMRRALEELQPAYARAFDGIFAQQYFYNYNMLIAKREVLARYCAWLFPILARTEELAALTGSARGKRYLGYLGESLLTLYVLFHQKELKLAHTGRLMRV